MPEEIDKVDQHELIQNLFAPAPSEEFTFEKKQPDGSVKAYRVRVCLLRVEHEHEALVEAQKYAKQRGELPKEYGDVYREGQAVELVARCLCHPEIRDRPDGTSYYPRIFTSAAQLRQSFTAPEIALVLNMYEIVKAKYGPAQHIIPDEIQLWAERLSDPDTMRGATFLASLDSQAWPTLLLLFAQELRRIRESSGAPPLTSPDMSESDPESSDPGTGSFTSLPSGSSADGTELPGDRLLTPEEAAEWNAKRGK